VVGRLLFGVQVLDVSALLTASAVLLLVVVLAVLSPFRHAIRVSPAEILR
jgi:ABC-type antimicrobial peptide transport system permease subunit